MNFTFKTLPLKISSFIRETNLFLQESPNPQWLICNINHETIIRLCIIVCIMSKPNVGIY